MTPTITSESMELLIENIIDAVENFKNDIDAQFEAVKTVLRDEGIVEVQDYEDIKKI